MRDFEMCAECRAEYEDPLRSSLSCRADSVSRLWATTVCLARSAFGPSDRIARRERTNLDRLRPGICCSTGRISQSKASAAFISPAMRSIAEAVEQLRKRKYREDKPFAMMATHRGCHRTALLVSTEEKRLLLSERRPIVLLKKKAGFKHSCGRGAGRKHSWLHVAILAASPFASKQSRSTPGDDQRQHFR